MAFPRVEEESMLELCLREKCMSFTTWSHNHEITGDHFLASIHKKSFIQTSVKNCTWLFLSLHRDVSFAFFLIFPLFWMCDTKVCNPTHVLFIYLPLLFSPQGNLSDHDSITFQTLSCANNLYSKIPLSFKRSNYLKLHTSC